MYESTLIATREEIEQILNKPKIPNDAPRVYIACLSAYNNGYLHGKWIDCTLGYDNLQEEIQEIFNTSPTPGDEWAIHDYDFYGMRIDEWHDLHELCELAEIIVESDNPELFSSVCDHLNVTDPHTVKEFIDDNYQGSYNNLEDYAYQFCDDTDSIQEIPKHLQGYIDYAAMGRDMEWSGDIFTIELDCELHVFWNH